VSSEIAKRFMLGIALGALLLGGCASGGGESAEAEKAAAKPPPAGHPLAKVESGMDEYAVVKVMGEPTHRRAYQTGKAWIPYYYGSDVSREEWVYSKKGRVVFSRNRYSGNLKVIRVLYEPEI